MATVGTPSSLMLSDILERLCINLQLRGDQVERATQSYQAVTGWLGAEGSPIQGFSPYLFPQGSLRLDTTVRPIKQNEFDLDVVCKLDVRFACDPQTVYELVWNRLQDHGTYSRIAQRMPRCIRLNYAEESQFHLDVVPAVPDLRKGGSFILIPDRPKLYLTSWKTSNPVAYAIWFESQTQILLEKFARAGIEPLRQPKPSDMKAILTKAVQLLKRWRDVRFATEPELGPPSIILTTLAAQIYFGERNCVDAMDRILEAIVQFVETRSREIRNPVNQEEIISEKWLNDPKSYDAFARAIIEFRDQWTEMTYATGIPTITDKLKTLFGEPVVRAVKEASESITQARTNGALHLDKKTGMLLTGAGSSPSAATAVRVKPNTHFGD